MDGYQLQASFRWLVDVLTKHAANEPEKRHEAAIAELVVNDPEFRALCERKIREGS